MKKFIALMLFFLSVFTLIGCKNDVLPTGVTITSPKTTITVGEEITVSATVTPDGATDKELEWTSGQPNVATVTKSGTKIVVKGLAEGTTKIKATAKAASDIYHEITITVEKAPDVLPTGLALTNAPTSLGIGENVTLQPKFTPANTTNQGIDWSSSDNTVATVSETGVVTGVKLGNVTITGTSKAKDTIKVELALEIVEKIDVESIAITGSASQLGVGGDLTLGVNFTPANTSNKGITWSTSDSTVATVSAAGVVHGVKEGTVTITATSVQNTTINATVTIEVVAGVSIAVETITLSGQEVWYTFTKAKLTATVAPATATNKVLSWTSSDESVATVDENGNVTAVTAGVVTIKATATDESGVYGTLELTIQQAVAPDTFQASAPINLTEGIKFGYKVQITITVTPANGDPRATYVSNDPSIATVDANGLITAVAPGMTTITVSSTASSFTATVQVLVNDGTIKTDPVSIVITGETTLYVGYPIKLDATVYPLGAVQNVTWTSANTSTATVSSDGTVTPLKAGTVTIRAISTADPTVSGILRLTIDIYVEEVIPDLKGYEIIIMQADSALHEVDPFLEKYTAADQAYKQLAWNEVQTDFNCKITVTAYPSTAPWGTARINWIIDNAKAGTAKLDLGIVASNWIREFGGAGGAADVTEYYGKYGKSQMEPTLKSAGSHGGKLYVASTGISPTATYITLGLYYNMSLLKKSGAEDPAKMFNEGNWTYSKFETWVKTAQAGLGEGEKVLGGHPYYYWFGMTNAAGQKVGDTATLAVNISTTRSKDASALIYRLVEAQCVNTTVTWAESDGGFVTGKDLMSTGYYWFLYDAGRWKEGLWGADNTSYGYVPFPYPDDMKKEDTRVSVDGTTCYMYSAGRQYPAGVDLEKVYQAMNAMFLRTIEKQKADPYFDAQAEKSSSLRRKIDNPASIVAAMYYDASKVFFDPAHAIYSSTAATPLKTPADNVLFKGKNYDEEFDAVYSSFSDAFIKYFG